MCGWDRRAAACASARIQSRDASSTASPARTLTATGRPSTSSYARHTTDIPPPPRRSTSRYRSPSRSTPPIAQRSGSSQSGTSGRNVEPGSWLSASSSVAGGTCTTSSSASTSVDLSSITSGTGVSSVMLPPYPLAGWHEPGIRPRPHRRTLSAQEGVGALKMSTRAVFAIAALGGLALLTGCGAANGAHWQAAGTVPGQKAPAAPAVTARADGATNVATATELSLTCTDVKPTVTLAAADGTAVPGALRADGSTWVPGTQLKWNTAYTATVATPGRPAAKKVTFTTLNKPDNLVRVSTPLEDDAVYGVAMPLVVRFDTAIPKEQRAAVEKRLFVTSTPAQPRAWNWFNGTQVHFRPAEYWQEGTKLTLRIATGGLAPRG